MTTQAQQVMEDRRINILDRRTHHDRRESNLKEDVLEAPAGGSFVEFAGGLGAAVLAIAGLAGIASSLMVAVATIAVGASMLIKGLATGTKYSEIMQQVGGNELHSLEFGGGLSGEIIAGLAGLVLGILSLLGINPTALLPCAAIVLGTGLFFSAGASARLNDLRISHQAYSRIQRILAEMVNASADSQMLVGLGAIVLGILALVGVTPVPLTLVAMLSLAIMELLSGSVVGAKLMAMVKGRA